MSKRNNLWTQAALVSQQSTLIGSCAQNACVWDASMLERAMQDIYTLEAQLLEFKRQVLSIELGTELK